MRVKCVFRALARISSRLFSLYLFLIKSARMPCSSRGISSTLSNISSKTFWVVIVKYHSSPDSLSVTSPIILVNQDYNFDLFQTKNVIPGGDRESRRFPFLLDVSFLKFLSPSEGIQDDVHHFLPSSNFTQLI